jgi:hypothetical protein
MKSNQICSLFYLVLLNNCMNTHKDDELTNKWLKANGINPKTITTWNKELLQAQMIATNLLKHHGKLLGQNQAATLNNFLRASNSKPARDKLKLRDCYRVMNIGTAVNRKLFKAHRTLQK